MFCSRCGQQIPDDAKFCFKCGTPIGTSGATGQTASAPNTPAAPPVAPSGVTEFKCPSCGAPLHPVFGEAVISCDYCGSSVSLGGNGWKAIQKHTMLAAKLTDPASVMPVVRAYVDTGFLHRKRFEESTVGEQKLTMVPYWVLPVAATTNYQYQDVAVSAGSTMATMAGSALLGNALSRGRGNTFIPIMAGPVVNPTRQDTISETYDFPIVAVRSLNSYQPKEYAFALADRAFFDKKGVPAGVPILNGDLTEEAARSAARSYVTQLQTEAAHKRHRMVSQLHSDVQVSEGELLHVPIWQVSLDRKGERTVILVDAHASKVMTPIS